VASIIECIDLGCASNPMRVLIRLIAPPYIQIKYLIKFIFIIR
jgi:hypothetical protein